LRSAKRERASTDIDRAQLLDGLAQRTGGSSAARNDVTQRLIGCKCEGFCRDFDHFSDKLSAIVLHRKRRKRRRRKNVVLEVARSLTDFGILLQEPGVLTQRTVVFNGHSFLYDFAAIAKGFADRYFDRFHDQLSPKVLHRKRRRSIMFFKHVVLEVARSPTDFGICIRNRRFS